jgi:DNA-binding transcriptional regulator LsrR (DeoR family)
MKHRNRDNHKKQISTGAAILLRLDHGAMAEIARRVGVHRSMVSKVVRGLKTSERVRIAIIRYLLRRNNAPRTALVVEHGDRR